MVMKELVEMAVVIWAKEDDHFSMGDVVDGERCGGVALLGW